MELALDLDFDRQVASGSVEYTLQRVGDHQDLVLDLDALEIHAVRGGDGTPRKFQVGPVDPRLGAPLRIELRPEDATVRIDYATTADSKALQWLAPEQTHGGQERFLFTQGQAILTRSWIPCQDSPGVRMTYAARITVPPGLTAVMSAEQLGKDQRGGFRFRMPQPIPPYLIALACGDLEFRAISPRCGVWAEPSQVAAAAAELEDTEAMIQAVESMFGPYRWGRYDLLILPPAFPFGGMENPRLTFATPTILAGDKSLVALVAHELAHSWSGNLVTNATWSDFWLNEGFTVYLEQRIMEAVFGKERAAMEIQLGMQGLDRELAELEPWAQILHVALDTRLPDDAFSAVPYDKGAAFLRRLEELVGRERLDAFLTKYFDAHTFQSMTTSRFLEFLQHHLLAQDPAAARGVNIHQWVFEPGLPADAPRPAAAALVAVDDARQQWLDGNAARAIPAGTWVTHQWLHFLDGMPDALLVAQLAELDAAFAFTNSGNSEILAAWLVLCIRHAHEPAWPRLEQFLLRVGRRKFLKPLYSELAKTAAGKERALAIYGRARPRYHAVATGTLDKILGWQP
jgi:aminopeptidase N